jgi:hypothetical protein
MVGEQGTVVSVVIDDQGDSHGRPVPLGLVMGLVIRDREESFPTTVGSPTAHL